MQAKGAGESDLFAAFVRAPAAGCRLADAFDDPGASRPEPAVVRFYEVLPGSRLCTLASGARACGQHAGDILAMILCEDEGRARREAEALTHALSRGRRRDGLLGVFGATDAAKPVRRRFAQGDVERAFLNAAHILRVRLMLNEAATAALADEVDDETPPEASLVSAAALATGRYVRLIPDSSGAPRPRPMVVRGARQQYWAVEVAGDWNGTILGVRGAGMLASAAIMTVRIDDVANCLRDLGSAPAFELDVEARAGFEDGAGLNEGLCLLRERARDRMARHLNLDPLERHRLEAAELSRQAASAFDKAATSLARPEPRTDAGFGTGRGAMWTRDAAGSARLSFVRAEVNPDSGEFHLSSWIDEGPDGIAAPDIRPGAAMRAIEDALGPGAPDLDAWPLTAADVLRCIEARKRQHHRALTMACC